MVIEKPFGSDLASALHMASNITTHIRDDEIYRIDHYLGKAVVRVIPEFRSVV